MRAKLKSSRDQYTAPSHLGAEGRDFFQRAPWIILAPGAFLAATVLAINILGDGLRDTLDPRLAKRVGGVV